MMLVLSPTVVWPPSVAKTAHRQEPVVLEAEARNFWLVATTSVSSTFCD